MPVSNISEVLRGRCGLSRKSATKIAEKIRLSPEDSDYFVALVECEHGRSPSRKLLATEIVKNYQAVHGFGELDLDLFRIIAEWYHFAILELTEIRGFQSNARWVARRLGITEREADEGVQRLIACDLLKADGAGGRWVKTHANLATPSGIPSQALREHHSQILDRAKTALENVPVEERDFSAVTMAISPRKLESARKLLKEFRRRFSEEVQDSEDKDRIYCLSVQFFPVDQQT